MSKLGTTIETGLAPDAAIERVTALLKDEGFGVLTRIDIDRAFAEKLGVDFRPYVILGACNPQLAHVALSSTPEMGLLLPCNVVVEATDAGSRVRIIDAKGMLEMGGVSDAPAIRELADDAGARLDRVAKALASE
jgi:uncharacterized protein (DUF302 family)